MPTIEVRYETHGKWVGETYRIPPPNPDFRCRIVIAQTRDATLDLLNGRFVRRPPFHRMPRQRFESKHHDHMDEFHTWYARDRITPLQKRLIARRQKRKPPSYWWGEFARMRLPARKGLLILHRQYGGPHRFIAWRP